MKKITKEKIINWFGQHSIDEWAELVAELINCEYAIEDCREEILDYNEE